MRRLRADSSAGYGRIRRLSRRGPHMTGRIVVGIDGSPPSGNALEWAVARARLGGEQLDLVHAYSLTPELNFYGYHSLPVASQPVGWFTEFSEQVLDAAAAH